jgi:hypothetical protein
MKKPAIIVTLLLLIGLLSMTGQALARSPIPGAAKGPPKTSEATREAETEVEPAHTPGAQATAHAGFHGKPQILRGTISAVDASSLTLTLEDGSSVQIGLTPATKIHIPGPKGLGNALTVGMRAFVMAYTDPAGRQLVARMLHVVPGQPVRAHRVGKVTAYTAGSSITIQATDGNSYTFALTSDTKILPEGQAAGPAAGSLVTVIAPRVPSSAGWTAKGIVVHPGP